MSNVTKLTDAQRWDLHKIRIDVTHPIDFNTRMESYNKLVLYLLDADYKKLEKKFGKE